MKLRTRTLIISATVLLGGLGYATAQGHTPAPSATHSIYTIQSQPANQTASTPLANDSPATTPQSGDSGAVSSQNTTSGAVTAKPASTAVTNGKDLSNDLPNPDRPYYDLWGNEFAFDGTLMRVSTCPYSDPISGKPNPYCPADSTTSATNPNQ